MEITSEFGKLPYAGWMSIFINKVLLEHPIPVCLYIIYGYFSTKTIEVSSWNRDSMACKPILTCETGIQYLAL